MQYNWRTIKGGDKPGEKYFCRPGYEEKQVLDTHDLCGLIDTDAIGQDVSAIPRIQKPNHLSCGKSLVDLEHFVTQRLLANYSAAGPESLQGYLSGCWYLTALPQALNPFRKGEKSTKLFLVYEPNEERCIFEERDDQGYLVNREGILEIRHVNISRHQQKRIWLDRNYEKLLDQYAAQLACSKKQISLRYGELSFVHRQNREYEYSDQFGLVAKMDG